MSYLKLITEHVDHQDLEILSEELEGGGKVYKLRGNFLQAEILNKNRRIYPLNVLLREVDKFKSEKISKRDALCEWEHPQSASVNRERACALIESIEQNGNNFIGTAKVLVDWPLGRLVYNCLKEGIPVGMSSRALGTVNESTRRVNTDMNLVTVDAVPTPSGPDCFVEGILESKNFIISGDSITEIAVSNLKKNLDRNGSKEITKYLKEFLNSLGK